MTARRSVSLPEALDALIEELSVEAGQSASAWVAAAVRSHSDHQQRLAAGRAAMIELFAEQGEPELSDADKQWVDDALRAANLPPKYDVEQASGAAPRKTTTKATSRTTVDGREPRNKKTKASGTPQAKAS